MLFYHNPLVQVLITWALLERDLPALHSQQRVFQAVRHVQVQDMEEAAEQLTLNSVRVPVCNASILLFSREPRQETGQFPFIARIVLPLWMRNVWVTAERVPHSILLLLFITRISLIPVISQEYGAQTRGLLLYVHKR